MRWFVRSEIFLGGLRGEGGGGREGRCDDLRTDQVTAWRQNNLPGYFPSVPSPVCCYVAPSCVETLYFTQQVPGYNSINSDHQLHSYKFTLKLKVKI